MDSPLSGPGSSNSTSRKGTPNTSDLSSQSDASGNDHRTGDEKSTQFESDGTDGVQDELSLVEQFSSFNITDGDLTNEASNIDSRGKGGTADSGGSRDGRVLGDAVDSPVGNLRVSTRASPAGTAGSVKGSRSNGDTASTTGPPPSLISRSPLPRDKFIVRKRAQYLEQIAREQREEEEDVNSTAASDIINQSIHLPHIESQSWSLLGNSGKTFRSSSNVSEISQLRKELTDCKIQLKLQRDLLREKFSEENRPIGKASDVESDVKNISDLEATNKALRGEIDQLVDSFGAVQRQLDKMQLDYEDWQRIVGGIVKKAKKSTDVEYGKGSELKERLEVVNKIVEQLMKEKSEGDRQVKENAAAAGSLRIKLESVLDDLESQRTQYAKLAKLVEELKAERSRTGGDQSRTSNAASNERITELENELETKEDHYRQLEVDFKHSQDRIARLLGEQTESAGEIDSLREKLDEVEELKVRLAESDTQSGSQLEEIAKLTAENTELVRNLEDTDGASRVAALLSTDINFQTHAIKIFSRLLDKKSIREAAEKILQLANRNQLNLSDGSVRQLLSAVYEYLLAGIQTIVENRLEVADEAATRRREDQKTIGQLEEELTRLKSSESPASPRSRLRLDELTKRWKAAEEALSFERKQSRRRLDELEAENEGLRQGKKELE
ncbi:DEKNAAC104938 [Brettanomyces naardenensis]|uniref:DEKNAAC104938 n=1 Tax=Brettanomyces naardenensis TaxID=13370 RepID=A0A448YSB2_BRENA|nr:DEKNAAC104938 [Brettanomyces naardenensis]